MVVRLFTSFYAGVNTLFEIDLKKLIALSTLSHLGFIGFSLAGGLLALSFFHLLVHALFKSLLFIAMGDIITNLNHSQDIRYLSSGYGYTPFSVFIMCVSILNLLGMPRVSGFFSKDFVLELFLFSNTRLVLIIIIYLNVAFTYYYTFVLLCYSFTSNKIVPFASLNFCVSLHWVFMLILG